MRLHLLCEDGDDVVRSASAFVTPAFGLPLWKARRVAELHLHASREAAPWLSGQVAEVLLNPDTGRVAFRVERSAEAGVVPKNWAQWCAFGPTARSIDPALARVIVRLGFVVAGADGLDPAEKAALEAFSAERSGLEPDAVAAEARAAEAGVPAIGEADLRLLAGVPAELLSDLFDEIGQAVAADGLLSKAEADTLHAVRTRVHAMRPHGGPTKTSGKGGA